MAGTNVILPQAGDEVTAAWGQDVAKGLNGIQSGVVNVTTSASQSANSAVVTFPKAYAATPVVVATVFTSTGVWVGVVYGATALNATIGMFHRAGTQLAATVAISWVAFGQLA